MGKKKKTLAIILSMLMAVQTPVLAGELMVEEESPVIEEVPAEEVLIEEELSEVVTEEPVEEEILGGELLEESEEDSLIPGDSFEEELVEDPIEAITEEVPAEQINTFPSEEEVIIEEDEPSLVGETSGQCGDNVNWTLSDDGVLTIYGSGDMYNTSESDVWWGDQRSEITSIIVEPGVTSIGDNAFGWCGSLMSVTIPNSVTSIGGNAFNYCRHLSSVTIPDSVKSIGGGAFFYCSDLTSVTIPDSVTSIGDEAFGHCNALTSVTIGNSVTSISLWAFDSCTSLKSVTIPKSVRNIDLWAFAGCSSLTDVYYAGTEQEWNAIDIDSSNDELLNATIHYVGATSGQCGDNVYWTLDDSGLLTLSGEGMMWDFDALTGFDGFGGTWPSQEEIKKVIIENGITSIGDSTFMYCFDLVSVTIPDSVTSIGGSAFFYCRKLENIVIPNGITRIEVGTFSECDSLKKVTIPDSVKSIGKSAFKSCSSLTSIMIPDSVTSIEDSAFNNCYSLTNVTIGDGVTSIGDSVFEHCSSLTEIIVSANNGVFSSVEGVLFNKDRSTLICVPNGKSGAYMIPDSVTKIENKAFKNCGVLTDVTIPSGITSISERAFEYCQSLKSVTIPDSVTSIQDAAFAVCSSLTSVTIPESVTSVGGAAFSNCNSLISLTIPDSVTSIGAEAFRGCKSLTSVTIGDGVTSLGDFLFIYSDSLDTVTFKGDAPSFTYNQNFYDHSEAFFGITATAYFPAGNPTWTADVMQDYGGNITWIPMRSNGKIGFTDVTNPDDFFYEPIYWAVDNGITTGYSDNTFRPNALCHRAAVVTFLWRMAGKPDEGISTAFSDMTGNDDFNRAITWASNHGIAAGYNDGTFRPYDPCHRAAIVTFLWRYAGRPEPISMANFSDMTGNDDFNKAISWAAENGITTGWADGTFRPYDSCKRLAVASFLYRYAHL